MPDPPHGLRIERAVLQPVRKHCSTTESESARTRRGAARNAEQKLATRTRPGLYLMRMNGPGCKVKKVNGEGGEGTKKKKKSGLYRRKSAKV
jgi:hypothetical protein